MTIEMCSLFLGFVEQVIDYIKIKKCLARLSPTLTTPESPPSNPKTELVSQQKNRFSQKKRSSLDKEKVFLEKKLFYFFGNAHLKKKRTYILPTL